MQGTQLSIVLDDADGDGKLWPDADEHVPIELEGIGVLPHATSGGRHAIVLRLRLPDGRIALAGTTLRLFAIAARAIASRYGDGNDEHGQA